MAYDSLSDCISTSAVVLSMVLHVVFGWNIDGWCSLIVALFIIYTGYSSIKSTINRIVGKAPDAELVNQITAIFQRYPEVQALQEMSIHDYGVGRFMVAAKIDVDYMKSENIIRNLPEEIGYVLKQEIGCESTIQINSMIEQESYEEIKKLALSSLKDYQDKLEINNVRIIETIEKPVIHMDITLLMRIEKQKKEIETILTDVLQQAYPEYRFLFRYKITHYLGKNSKSEKFKRI